MCNVVEIRRCDRCDRVLESCWVPCAASPCASVVVSVTTEKVNGRELELPRGELPPCGPGCLDRKLDELLVLLGAKKN